MTAEELKLLETLTNEIKGLNQNLTLILMLKYAEIRFVDLGKSPSESQIRRRVDEAKETIEYIKNVLKESA